MNFLNPWYDFDAANIDWGDNGLSIFCGDLL